MIKKFDEFNIEEVKENERDYFERELNARKKMREERNNTNDTSFDDIKDFITKEIENKEDYKITTGKKTIKMDDINQDEIHIEYQSPMSGRIKIFKPRDDSDRGYYDVNGKVFHEDSDKIRNFYQYLNLELIKKSQIVEKYKIKKYGTEI